MQVLWTYLSSSQLPIPRLFGGSSTHGEVLVAREEYIPFGDRTLYVKEIHSKKTPDLSEIKTTIVNGYVAEVELTQMGIETIENQTQRAEIEAMLEEMGFKGKVFFAGAGEIDLELMLMEFSYEASPPPGWPELNEVPGARWVIRESLDLSDLEEEPETTAETKSHYTDEPLLPHETDTTESSLLQLILLLANCSKSQLLELLKLSDLMNLIATFSESELLQFVNLMGLESALHTNSTIDRSEVTPLPFQSAFSPIEAEEPQYPENTLWFSTSESQLPVPRKLGRGHFQSLSIDEHEEVKKARTSIEGTLGEVPILTREEYLHFNRKTIFVQEINDHGVPSTLVKGYVSAVEPTQIGIEVIEDRAEREQIEAVLDDLGFRGQVYFLHGGYEDDTNYTRISVFDLLHISSPPPVAPESIDVLSTLGYSDPNEEIT